MDAYVDTPVATFQSDEIEHAIDLLISGRLSDLPEGSCSTTQKLKKLADQLLVQTQNQLERTVHMSVTANKGVSGVAEMMREIREVDSQSQAIAAAVEELAASVNSIADSSGHAAEEIAHVANSATSGQQAAENAKHTMEEINGAVKDAAQKVNQLSDASEEIGLIVEDIESIAKQTNLLALNATIEAARAGEAGKGFAVVASEVKNLATQTAKSTENIRGRIESLRSEMAGIVTTMREGEEKSSKGQEVIAQSSAEMTRISDQVGNVNNRIQDINHTLSQQTEASREVSSGVSVIANMSRQNVQKVEHVIGVLEATGDPINESINDMVAQAGKIATIYAAKSDHMIWMRKLAQMLAGRMELKHDELADHHSCRLGKWYDQQTDTDFTSLPEWKALEAPHREVHAAGIEAARLYNAGNISGAVDAVHTANDASEKVMQYLDMIGNKIKK